LATPLAEMCAAWWRQVRGGGRVASSLPRRRVFPDRDAVLWRLCVAVWCLIVASIGQTETYLPVLRWFHGGDDPSSAGGYDPQHCAHRGRTVGGGGGRADPRQRRAGYVSPVRGHRHDQPRRRRRRGRRRSGVALAPTPDLELVCAARSPCGRAVPQSTPRHGRASRLANTAP